jgi:hypothetical protein
LNDEFDDFDDFDNDGSNDETNKKKEYDEVDLKYSIFTDDENMTVYLKFHGFNNLDEIDRFAEYIKTHLPLILFDSDVKH